MTDVYTAAIAKSKASIERLEALRRSLVAAHKSASLTPGQYAVGLGDGLEIAINAIDLEIDMIEAGIKVFEKHRELAGWEAHQNA